ncbi:MAG: hypothetical protein F4Z81_00940 [Gemmatimonadetes bacterium]|nr:hypothetical protein [Gemmatimonadota bacterium]MYB62301.1 hypothetical protein [Gemmatimonadota bacterium]
MESLPSWLPAVVTILMIAVIGAVAKLCLWMGKREGMESGVLTTLEDIKEDIRTIRIAIADLVMSNESKSRQ